MPDLTVNARVTIPEDELRLSFARSGGPGGQNVNKVETKVEVRWRPAESEALSEADREWLLDKLSGRLTVDGDLIAVSSRHRTRERNRTDALEKLAETVRKALKRPKRRRPTRRTRASIERRLEEKKRRSDVKRSRGRRPDLDG
jgi:ribosome-associated protein